RHPMNKPSRPFARPLRDLAGKVVGDAFTRQGFASAELVTRWAEIVGAEVAVHSEPIKIQWTRPMDGAEREPGTLVLRVDGPAATETRPLATVICDGVTRFLGGRAIARVALRRAPPRRGTPKPRRTADPVAAARVAAGLTDVTDDDLRQALARLGAAIKR